jgi:hypothetical protein
MATFCGVTAWLGSIVHTFMERGAPVVDQTIAALARTHFTEG